MTKKIKLGFIDKKLERNAPFSLVAGDKNAYQLELDMSKYQEATELFIYAKRADGEIVYDSYLVEGGKVSYTLKQSIYSVPGELLVRLVLKGTEDTILTAAELNFEVLPGFFEGTPVDDVVTVEGFIIKFSEIDAKLDKKADKQYVDTSIGDIETALDNIIAIQNSLIGGEAV